MHEGVEATLEPNGAVRLHEPVRFPVARRALVIILDDGASIAETALSSGRTLAADCDRVEGDVAWAHVQRGR